MNITCFIFLIISGICCTNELIELTVNTLSHLCVLKKWFITNKRSYKIRIAVMTTKMKKKCLF